MVQHISVFDHCEKLFDKYLEIRVLKNIIKDETGIKEENQRFSIHFKFNMQKYDIDYNNGYFWFYSEILVFDITNYEIDISRGLYTINVTLDLNKNVEELKKMVYEQTKIPVKRLQFYLNDKLLSEEKILKDENLFDNKLSIKIIKESNDLVNIKYPNSEIKQIRTDLCSSGLEFLEQVQNFSAEKSLKYIAFYKNEQIDFGKLLINYGIKGNNKEKDYDNKNIDFIELKIRETFQIFVKEDTTGRTLTYDVGAYDTIKLLKFYIYNRRGFNMRFQKLVFGGKLLENKLTLKDYNIQKESTFWLGMSIYYWFDDN